MSTRGARARARASRAVPPPAQAQPQPPQPNIGAAGGGNVQLTNTQKYREAASFSDLLQRIGVTQRCINQLRNDDFDTMETVVQQYKGNVTSFESYLKTINKTMTNAANPVRFSPVVMDRILAVIHHFIQAVTCFHTVPDMALIDRQIAGELIEPYRTYKQFSSEEIDEEILISLPELKGHENWISYRDKFLSNLKNTPGSNGTPLSYVVDETPRTVTRANHAFLEVATIDLNSWETYNSSMNHFGSHFNKDSSKVWQMLKKSLLGNQPYHHIDHCARSENGQRAWDSLRSYYEGEDYVNKTIQECLTKVRTMYYRGETPRFNFEKFIDKQKECYKLLRDVGYNNGAGVDDASKCSNLKQMILPDAQLETALSMARTQGLFNGPFDDLVHFLKAEVDELSLRRSQVRANRSHRVSAVASSQGNVRGGRNGGRDRRNPRPRQNSRNPRNRQILTRFVDGRNVHSGTYSPDEYRRLTPSQREAVKALRQQLARQRPNERHSNNNPRAGVSGVSTSIHNVPDGTSAPTNNSSDMPTSSSGISSISAPSGGVGSYLGNRRSHNSTPSRE